MKLRDALAAAVPGQRFYIDRASLFLTARWAPVVAVQAQASGEVHLKWNPDGLERLGLRRADLEPAALAAVAPPTVRWAG